MLRRPAALVLLAAAAGGCSPTFNWREVRAEPAPLKAALPCKPERGARRVALAGSEVEMAVTGCDTGGATFAILQADLGDPLRAPQALEQWHRATLGHLRAGSSRSRPFLPPGAVAVAGSQRVSLQGQRPDGSTVQGEAAYFAHGSRVFQAVVYAPQARPELVQPFFEGLRFE